MSEDEIADAMVFLADRAKLVAEGAGAVAVATLLGGRLAPRQRDHSGDRVGGQRRQRTARRPLAPPRNRGGPPRAHLHAGARPPGGLAELLNLLAAARANLLSLEHVREAVALHVHETGVGLTLQTRGPAHTEEVLAALAEAGYEVTLE